MTKSPLTLIEASANWPQTVLVEDDSEALGKGQKRLPTRTLGAGELSTLRFFQPPAL